MWISIPLGLTIGNSFRYSRLNQRLICNRKFRFMSVFNIETRREEVRLANYSKAFIIDFEFLGKKDDQIVALDTECWVEVFHLAKRTHESDLGFFYRYGIIMDQGEKACSLAADSKGEYILLCLSKFTHFSKCCSRLIVLKYSNFSLVFVSSLDLSSVLLVQLHTLRFVCYDERDGPLKLVFLGMTRDSQRAQNLAVLVLYDTEGEEIEQSLYWRVKSEETEVAKVCELGGWFYYTGGKGSIMRLKKLSAKC